MGRKEVNIEGVGGDEKVLEGVLTRCVGRLCY